LRTACLMYSRLWKKRASQKLTHFAKSHGRRVSESLRTNSDPLSRLIGSLIPV
jgi:hypothetical protein